MLAERYRADADLILSRRDNLGADYWTTPDKRLGKGSPFSTFDCAHMLLELGMEPSDPVLTAVAELVFSVWRKDGRFKLSPSGGLLPCQTAYAAALLCRMGYVDDERVKTTLQYFLDTPWSDGGWRCNKFSFGREPATEFSNPLPTLNALDAFRYCAFRNCEPKLDRAVEFLLQHWRIRTPIGPCQYGIGTRFMQVEYPLWGYSLFPYVHVLSFYDKARSDDRFREAAAKLQGKLVNGQIVVERISPKLSGLEFCRKGQPSALATRRYQEIVANLNN